MSNSNNSDQDRGQWGSRLGFILAAAGSAVGLGNIWKFPYITGENGGGWFVLIYLACIAAIGLPILTAEIIIGRRAKRAPVSAFARLSGEKSAWRVVGWMGVVTGFIILSYYSVVAGWAVNYTTMAVRGAFDGASSEDISNIFSKLYGSPERNVFWHFVFMAATVGIVIGGVRKGIEAWSRLLMPALFILLIVLLVDAVFQSGFGQAVNFIFVPHANKLSAGGALEALGHSFFTLSLGMGALITYGSYMRKDDDIVKASFAVAGLDTLVALMACLILFPVIFSAGMDPQKGPGLVFQSIPLALSDMPGGLVLTIVFFVLLVFAALTSAISLLEVVTSTLIDYLSWSRRKAALVTGSAIFVFGIPSALSGSDLGWFGEDWKSIFGKNFFDSFDYLASNWLLPVGGFFIAIYVGWVMPTKDVRDEFTRGTTLGRLFPTWYAMLRYLVPVAVLLLFAYSVGLIPKGWID